jgi:undecaprenyl-diphosphatase
MDSHLLFLLNSKWTHPFLDRVLGILSCMEFWFPIFALGAVLLLWKYGIRGAACLIFCALTVLVNEEGVSQPLKKWTARARPHQSQEGVRRVDMAPIRPKVMAAFSPMQISFSGAPNPKDTNKRSFPSSHTLNATTLGLVFALFFRSRVWLLLPLLMAWSRVYTGAHWPSDVLSSLVLGLFVNGGLIWAAEWFWRRRLDRLRPEWVRRWPVFLIPSATFLRTANASSPV